MKLCKSRCLFAVVLLCSALYNGIIVDCQLYGYKSDFVQYT